VQSDALYDHGRCEETGAVPLDFPGPAHADRQNFTNVFSLVDAANTYGTPGYIANMQKLADMENWMRVSRRQPRVPAIGNSYGAQNGQNMYAYIGALGTKWSFLTYDFNTVLGNSGSWGPGQKLFTVNDQDRTPPSIYREPVFPPYCTSAGLAGAGQRTAQPR